MSDYFPNAIYLLKLDREENIYIHMYTDKYTDVQFMKYNCALKTGRDFPMATWTFFDIKCNLKTWEC